MDTVTLERDTVRLRCLEPGCRFRIVTEWPDYDRASLEFAEHWREEHGAQ